MHDAPVLGCSHAAGALMHEEPGLVLAEYVFEKIKKQRSILND